eukprot:CAMPEP_0204571310 /NCGR_PEP_ID=MMETSP0661-20131031/38818_1 /ASSEMBLY_ACC=CAM_ASM_000606 /TAXON_ID=109239 /ORGANISM="Alexandrium margalefi, Strain AMGDE01CS-322" /LENGTH=413 /DNA_ID=CAMNT_0051579563 /DNA_START=58 /DNA_END=1299 /DNA_ORIENTATION=-
MARPGVALALALALASLGPCASLRRGGAPPRTDGAADADGLDPWSYRPEAGYIARMRCTNSYARSVTSDGPSCGARAAEEEGLGRTPEYSKWQFEPPGSKEWLQFDHELFCHKMAEVAQEPGHARMLFIGDSMSQHMMISLGMLLRAEQIAAMRHGDPRHDWMREDDYEPQKVEGFTKNGAVLACDGQLYIQQEGTNTLVEDYSEQFRFAEHVDWLRSFDVVVVMLPWIYKEADVLRLVDAFLPRQKVLLRTPTIGHERTGAQYNHSWDATDLHPMLRSRPHRAPLRSPQEVVGYYRIIEGHATWMRLRQRYERAIPVLEGRGLVVADFWYLAAMTWDRHRDPLHFCTPGPIDRWNDVLLNWLVHGHLRDFRAWSAAFAEEVNRLGGLVNSRDVQFNRGQYSENYSDPLFMDE